jgi:antirestriction protein
MDSSPIRRLLPRSSLSQKTIGGTQPMTEIFIQSLADYNAGRTAGKWFDVSRMDAEELQDAIAQVLSLSPEPSAREAKIADYNDFYGLTPDWEQLLEVARTLRECGEAYALYALNIGEDCASQEGFEEAYCGAYASFLDYATALFQEIYVVPDNILMYIDYQEFASDLLACDYYAETGHDGTVHVFRNR